MMHLVLKKFCNSLENYSVLDLVQTFDKIVRYLYKLQANTFLVFDNTNYKTYFPKICFT